MSTLYTDVIKRSLFVSSLKRELQKKLKYFTKEYGHCVVHSVTVTLSIILVTI